MDGRAPGADEVDQFLAVGGGEAGAAGTSGEERRAAHGAEGPNWRVDPAGDQLLGAFKESGRVHGKNIEA